MTRIRRMVPNIEPMIKRQNAIANGSATPLDIPKFKGYTICNLRGGIGKTSLAFNLSYLINNLLVVDTCPQGNLSYFFDSSYFHNNGPSVYQMLLPYFMPGLGNSSGVAQQISASNEHFEDLNNFFIPSSDQLYVLPGQMAYALSNARSVAGPMQITMLDNMLYALKKEIEREQKETKTTHCLIDTSPFFSGATHLAWHATDALIIPVRTDQQSINSLNLLINTLSNSSSEFRRVMPSDNHAPKIQLIVLTHCGWSTSPGARNEPNNQTRIFIQKVYDIVKRNISHFTTDEPENHIVLLDDFLGSGRISTAKSKPIALLNPKETMIINRVKTEVNESVTKIKNQLRFISKSIWD
ncbi:ParA family protein [Laribacter hongkongensis]|uniref:ParA family protein n=1 Tax=Laribacter hongkongensis TaxID=168471 RepID=A0ABD4SW33_9NEIS|nr:ParA family protein [Laribacter hongkongensis]MCG9027476.1 ParA family protein [Laribacter hongkongensis]